MSAAVVVVSASVSAFGVVAAMVHSHRGLARYDFSWARWGANNASPTSTQVLKFVSLLGGYPTVVGLAVVVAAFESRRRVTGSVAPLLAAVVVGQFGLTNLIKFLVQRTRPDVSRLTGFAGSSFPSGHAAAAAASYAVFALVLGRRRSARTRALLAAGATSIAVTVAATRVLLGVHWLTDVVAGLFVGWTWFALLSIAFGGRVMRFGLPLAVAKERVQTTEQG